MLSAARQELASLTVESFAPYVGTAFEVRVSESAEPVAEAILIEATQLREPSGQVRGAFSLMFDGPPDVAIGQGTVLLTNDSFGTIALFWVPVSGDSEKRSYQAIFN